MFNTISNLTLDRNKSLLDSFLKDINKDFNTPFYNNYLFLKDTNSLLNNSFDEASLEDEKFPIKELYLDKNDFCCKSNNIIGKNNKNVNYITDFDNINNIINVSLEKNRNYFISNKTIFLEHNEDDNNNNISSINNKKYIRCDSLLIKFKSALGKWFIKIINQRIKTLKEKDILKRGIKIYAFNYKKFTLNVNYEKNKIWLDYKMKDLLLLGNEGNQIKNMKSLKSLYKRRLEELKEIKDMFEMKYKKVIERFYLSEDFDKFINNKRVKELDKNFKKIMGISLLEKNGFIIFLESRKGNNKK